MKSLRTLLFLAAFLVSGSASAITTVIQHDGTFTSDDEVDAHLVILTETSLITAETFSYAGGTRGDGSVVAEGGFDPILSLFHLAGTPLIAQNDDGTSRTSSVTGASFDSFIGPVLLGAGQYLLYISQFANFPTDPLGFPGSGRTGFVDVTGATRTGDYAIDLTISTVPVPAAGILFASALFGAGALSRRKKKTAKTSMVGAFTRAS